MNNQTFEINNPLPITAFAEQGLKTIKTMEGGIGQFANPSVFGSWIAWINGVFTDGEEFSVSAGEEFKTEAEARQAIEEIVTEIVEKEQQSFIQYMKYVK